MIPSGMQTALFPGSSAAALIMSHLPAAACRLRLTQCFQKGQCRLLYEQVRELQFLEFFTDAGISIAYVEAPAHQAQLELDDVQ